jgi:hypothetical protein
VEIVAGLPGAVVVRTAPGSGRPDPSSRQLSLL